MICEGDVIQYDKILHSPVSLYAAKLQHFATVHKMKEKKPPAPTEKRTPRK